MNAAARQTQRVYLALLLLHTLAASFIWGINTLFLLDAGLSNAQAFAANACFTAGSVLFEVPTGVLADMRGRRFSYLVGTLTLALSTLLYLLLWQVRAPFWAWALSSALLGLGFTFFSGAVEAWLVDALEASGYFREGFKLESVLARGEVVEGIAMVAGSVLGGALAQATNLSVPYLLRALVLLLGFGLAYLWMHDIGFTPNKAERAGAVMRSVLRSSVAHGFGNPPVRWLMLAAPFASGVSIYAFYAMQPYLLQLYGDPRAYGVAGLAAAIVGGAQIAGGLLVARVSRWFRRRTSALLLTTLLSAALLAAMGLMPRFWLAVLAFVLWGLIYAAEAPVRQAYLNGLIASKDRATVLSFDSLLGSSGGVVIQPALGRAADASGYAASYVWGAAIQMLALPFVYLARRERAASDASR